MLCLFGLYEMRTARAASTDVFPPKLELERVPNDMMAITCLNAAIAWSWYRGCHLDTLCFDEQAIYDLDAFYRYATVDAIWLLLVSMSK